MTERWIISAAAGLGLAACAINEMPEPPEGARLFAENCAACHGADGTGAGREALGIGKVPPDLTVLATNNGGAFPTARVLSTIDGYAKNVHPARVMPEFGADLSGDLVPVIVQGIPTPTPRALAALLAYLEEIQS